MHLDRPSLPHCIHFLVGLALDIHTAGIDSEDARDIGPHLVLVRRELRFFEDDGGVDVDDFPSALSHPARGFAEKIGGVLGFVALIGVGKQLADVGQAGGGENGIGDRVVEGIAIGVADGAAIVVEADSAENQWAAIARRRQRFEAVEVITVADPVLGVVWLHGRG